MCVCVSRRCRRQFAGTRRVPEGRRLGAGHVNATLQRAEGADRRESRVLFGRGVEREERVARVAHAVHVARVPIYRTDRVDGGYVCKPRYSRACARVSCRVRYRRGGEENKK